MTDLNYWLEIVLSAGVAAGGLVVNSPTVIIGAMLVSPLMGPIMAMRRALAADDLYLTNLVAIVTSASVILIFTGMSTPEIRLSMEAARRGERFAQRLSHGSLAPMIAESGRLRWYVLLPVVLPGSVAVPLRSAFIQVAGETIVWGTELEVIKSPIALAMIK